VILARKIPLARETGISSARVEFEILKIAFVVRYFICAKNEILSVKGGGILKI
jgi:hypothetical protein